MAGYDAILPPMSSDPQARVWTQIRQLQQRVASLEARRDLIVRAEMSGTVISSDPTMGTMNYRQGEFSSYGRELLVLFGPNRAALSGSTSISAYFYIDEQQVASSSASHNYDPDQRNMDGVAASAAYTRFTVPAGTHTWRVAAGVSPPPSSFTAFDFAGLILELPTA